MLNVSEGNMRKHGKDGSKTGVFFVRKLQTKSTKLRESHDLVIAGLCRSTEDLENVKWQNTAGLGSKHPSTSLRNFLKGCKL